MDEAGIYARAISGLDRAVQLGIAGGRVISLSFPRTVDSDTTSTHDLLDRIESHVGGELDSFDDVSVGLTVPTVQRSVLETLRGVPVGETVTVSELTHMTPGLDGNDPDDRQIVTQAVGVNPVPLLIPDHRIRDVPSSLPEDVLETLKQVEGIDG